MGARQLPLRQTLWRSKRLQAAKFGGELMRLKLTAPKKAKSYFLAKSFISRVASVAYVAGIEIKEEKKSKVQRLQH